MKMAQRLNKMGMFDKEDQCLVNMMEFRLEHWDLWIKFCKDRDIEIVE